MHEGHDEVALIKETRDPELSRRKFIISCLLEQELDVVDPIAEIFNIAAHGVVARITVERPCLWNQVLLEAVKCLFCLIAVVAQAFHRCIRVVEVGSDVVEEDVVPLNLLRQQRVEGLLTL